MARVERYLNCIKTLALSSRIRSAPLNSNDRGAGGYAGPDDVSEMFTGSFPASPRRAAGRAGLGHDPVAAVNRLAADDEIPDTGIPSTMAARITMAEQYEWHQAYLRRHPDQALARL